MKFLVSSLLACCLFVPSRLSAAEIKGKITDPSGAPIAGAQVSLVNRLGVELQTVTSADGSFAVTVDDRCAGLVGQTSTSRPANGRPRGWPQTRRSAPQLPLLHRGFEPTT